MSPKESLHSLLSSIGSTKLKIGTPSFGLPMNGWISQYDLSRTVGQYFQNPLKINNHEGCLGFFKRIVTKCLGKQMVFNMVLILTRVRFQCLMIINLIVRIVFFFTLFSNSVKAISKRASIALSVKCFAGPDLRTRLREPLVSPTPCCAKLRSSTFGLRPCITFF